MTRRLDYLVIGNPDNRRIGLFQAALARCGRRAADVIAYRDLLGDRDLLERWLALWHQRAVRSARLCIRLESPGECAQVEQELICHGLRLQGRRPRLKYEHGRIQHAKAWYAGYCDLLTRLAETVRRYDPAFERVRFASQPEEVLLAFDKPSCHTRLAQNSIPVPEALAGITGYEHLIACMQSREWSRVFVKLATGSSASGVVALHRTDKSVRAITSMEMIGTGKRAKFYNNLRLRTYTRERDVACIVNFLSDCGMHVERWLPKAALGDRNFDLRMLVIAGRPMHCVVRSSRSPITNLHLGNRRGDLEMLRQRMSRQAWRDVLDLASRTATTFPGSHMLGLDILLQPGFRRPTVLEANAFGDLLPGVLYRQRDSYEAQVRSLNWK